MRLSSNNCERLLLDNILPFWMTRMIDYEHKGFYGRIDGSNQLVADAPKSAILNTRILWSFAAVYNHFGDQQYKILATRAFDYLRNYLVDDEFGGVFWLLDHKGVPIETKKQVYAHAFAIYALSEFYQSTQNRIALELARSIYELIESHSFDSNKNGYLEAFNRGWGFLPDQRLSEKDANEAKTMNTHLHVLEAYTRLFQIWPDAELAKKLENLIELFLQQFINESGYFNLFFDEEWNLRSHTQSFGHDIEGGWLLLRAAEVLGYPELIISCQEAAITLTEAALKGMDQDGGLMYEGDKSQVTNKEKHWWPQAEALVGLVNAHQLSGDAKYLELADQNWNFIFRNLIDPEGEWHWMVNANGVVDHQEDKAGPWKAPYHNTRAMLELMVRLKP